MKHYDRNFKRIIVPFLKKYGFIIEQNKTKYKIFKGDGPVYNTHSGMRSYHPLRRFLKSEYGINIEKK